MLGGGSRRLVGRVVRRKLLREHGPTSTCVLMEIHSAANHYGGRCGSANVKFEWMAIFAIVAPLSSRVTDMPD